MRNSLSVLAFGLFILSSCTAPVTQQDNQKNNLKPIFELPRELNECSGMALLAMNLFVALNDGGDQPNLYVFSDDGKTATRIVSIANVENNDWEELGGDEAYLYIGDTGNNDGSRHNLMIYKVRKEDVRNKDTVVPEIIKFSYEDQVDFNPSNKNNFDCESMAISADSIFLFTKDRGDLRTNLYGFPKIAGVYVAHKLGKFDSKGLITGADFRSDQGKGELILVGYNVKNHEYTPFLIHFSNFTGTHFFNGLSTRIDFDRMLQTESVNFYNDHEVLLTNEKEKGGKAYIYEVSIPN